MKRLFKFLFNLARTLSLIFVLFLMAIFAYVYFSGALQKLVEEEPLNRLAYFRPGLLANEDPQTEKEAISSNDKVWLPARRATHFVRPAQTAFFSSYGGSVYAITAEKDTISGIRSPLTKIDKALSDQEIDYFFKTRDILINCHFVRQYYSENISTLGRSNYVHYAVMETGDTLTIPHNKYQAFLEKMATLALPLE